jgi:uncharacterized membrane protein YfcA
MPELEWWQWAVGCLCAVMVGASKTGLPGLSILVVPLMVLTVGDARKSAGWLLPLLSAADLMALYFWRRHADLRKLLSMIPWVLAGIALGAAALSLSERALRPIVGTIVLAMLTVFLYRRWRGTTEVAAHPLLYGSAAGFATTVANAAGPVMSLYLLSMRLPKEVFVGTGAWFFFVVNLTKLPIYFGHSLISRESLLFDMAMIPAMVAGAFGGRALLHRIPVRLFEILVVGLTVIATALLFR